MKMGFSFRKSVRLGPVRLNFSKSGIGVSAGVKGARISTGPRGTYVHAGTNGFSYRQRVSAVAEENRRTGPSDRATYPFASLSNPFVIETADVSELRETSITKLLDEINERASKMRIAPIALAGTAIVTIAVWGLALAITTPLADFVDPQSAPEVAVSAAMVSSLTRCILLSNPVHRRSRSPSRLAGS